MDDFIKYEVWEDYWCFKPVATVDFSVLKVLDYCSFDNDKLRIETLMEASRNLEKPFQAQIEGLDFVLKNQAEILSSIFNFYQRFIYPIYEASIDIEEDEIANDPSELPKVFGLKSITIPHFQESGTALYYLMKFDFRYDDEHDFYLLFENTSIIDFFGEGDRNYDAISIYQNGLANENGAPLQINLYQVPFESILKTNAYFSEMLKHPLKKGAYRVAVKCNESSFRINFYTSDNLEKFSLEQILTMK